MTSPGTVAEAVDYLATEGYSLKLNVSRDSSGGVPDITRRWLRALVVDHRFSFEAPGEAAPNEVVLAVRFPKSGIKGIITELRPPA